MSIKKLQRAIMLTQVYQLSTQNNDENYAKDSGDRFYWRANRHRLDAEELRDSVLAVAGNLDTALGGPSEELTPANLRRTVYGKVSRYKLDTYLSDLRFPHAEYQRGETLCHHRAAAAPVSDEQRLHADRVGGTGQACRRGGG